YAAQKEIPVDRLCRQAGVDLEALRSEQPFYLSLQQQNDLFEHAVKLSGDTLFGLHFGERLQLAALGIVGAVIRNSRTIGEALENCAAYSPILTDLFNLTVSFEDHRFIIRLLPFMEKLQGYPVLKRQLLELSMAFVLHEMDGLLLIKMKPSLVKLPYEEGELKEYQRVFRTTNIIRSQEYVVEFEYHLLKEPILTANYELQHVLIHRLTDIYRQFPDPTSVSSRLAQLMKGSSYLGLPDLREMGANLNMSVRTLQRKLKEEGVTYQQVAESVRKSLAIDYLNTGKHPIKQIAFMLGYNDPGAFTRAFKKWTGQTPQDFLREADSTTSSVSYPH
ncbi:MAG TPA: AraC family transcriptional regulator ligand-binding domain-containing protein, partial [Puia sp.]|nr:AraC family transcriptional regulator ligand-binding domain-containing protein [Puia sp.]